MWEGFIGKQIRRCNRNLLITNVLLLAACAGIGALNFNYLSNWFRGTAPTDPAQIAQLQSPDDLKRNFVSLNVPKVYESGYQWVEQDEAGKVTSVKADFQVAWVGERLLIVKTNTNSTNTHLDGQLVEVPSEVMSGLRGQLKPEQQGVLLPFMLDTVDYRDNGWWLLCLGVPLILLAVWNLTKWAQRNSNPASSPIVKRLGGEQGVMAIGQQLDVEMLGGTEKFGAAVVSPSFLHAPYLYDSKIIPLADLVWIHKKIIQRKVYGVVPAGKNYEALLYTRAGQSCSITGNEAQVNGLLAKLANQFPWIIAGWSAELEATWKKNAAGVIATVDQRRAQAKGAGAASTK